MTLDTDQHFLLVDILMGLASDEMLELLSRPDVDPEELISAVLSSRLSLVDKEFRLKLISELDQCDDSCCTKIKQFVDEIYKALSKLGTSPGVVWYALTQDGFYNPSYNQLMLSPDMLKPWSSFEHDFLECDLFDNHPKWTELWRLVPTETGLYRPDYVYFLYELTPIFFGLANVDGPFSFIDHGVFFSHPASSISNDYYEEYFGMQWTPSMPLPYEIGDIVNIDLRPFGFSMTACVIGDQNGRIGTADTQVLFMDDTSEGWRLSSLASVEKLYQGGNDSLFSRETKPRVSVFCGLSSSSVSGFDCEDQLSAVREYLTELKGFADRRSIKSASFQRDWDYAYGLDNAISDAELATLLHADSPYDPDTPNMF